MHLRILLPTCCCINLHSEYSCHLLHIVGSFLSEKAYSEPATPTALDQGFGYDNAAFGSDASNLASGETTPRLIANINVPVIKVRHWLLLI